MVETLLRMNRQTGEFRACYSEDLHLWYTTRLNVRYILFVLTIIVFTVICGYLGMNWDTGYIDLDYMAGIVVGLSASIILTIMPLLEPLLYKKVPIEQKQLLNSFVNPYFVFILPISGGGVTYYYMEDADNAYLLGTKTLVTTCLDKSKVFGGKSHMAVNGNTEPIDFDFCSKSASDIAEVIRKYSSDNAFRFSNVFIDSVYKTNRLYKAMMTEICS